MSSVLTGNHPSRNPAIAWAAAVFMAQAVLIGAPVLLHQGGVETRLATVEKQVSETQDKYTGLIDRLARIETKQDQLLLVITKKRKD